MKRIQVLTLAAIAALLASALPLKAQFGLDESLSWQSCTSIMVGRSASTDGSVMTSHTCDGRYRSWAYMEPAADHAKGEMMTIYKGLMHTSFRGDTTGVRAVGEIPQVKHTYAFLNTAYPCMNEKQLAIGETTFSGPDKLVNPKGLFMIEELCRVALQRCDNARDAIRTMGALAEKYGYGDSGECLTVADPKEVWQFEIVGVGKDEIGAAWVARRIPDDHVGFSANIPRIGKIDRKDKDFCMASDNVEEVMKKNGLWDGESEFVFWKAVKGNYGGGRNYHDREFFLMREIAPSLGLEFGQDEIPFSVKPDEKLDIHRVMELFRCTYEGTDFDMCRNVKIDSANVSPVANPWITNKWVKTLNQIAPGTVEFRRTVAVAWCAYSHVIQLRSWLPDSVGGICWFAVDNPGQSPRIPVFAGMTRLPEAYDRCGNNGYDEDAAMWHFRKANRLATLGWQETKTGFMANVQKIENLAFEGLPELEAKIKSMPRKGTGADVATMLNAYSLGVYQEADKTWNEMEKMYWSMFWVGF